SLMYPAYLNGRTTLIIVSDTKTVSIDRALTELGRLKNRVKKIIWLNPMPEELWDDYRSVRTVAQLVDMWPCSTIAQLEKVLDGRLSR
ncbi:MAG TPA: VWA domain-containing protein, partial [Firmicutes bacterium]|nr:VWA domain-containing protein [Bacillota bacterium]